MDFSIPLKYLYEENKIVDKELMDAICADIGARWDSFPEHIEDEEEFLTLFERICPEGEQVLLEGVLNVVIYDYYQYSFSKIPEYCEEHGIPINLIEEPEYASEQTFFTFIRPNRETKVVPVDEMAKALVSVDEVMKMINDADEEMTDTEIMIAISNHLENNNPHSAINSITNWV